MIIGTNTIKHLEKYKGMLGLKSTALISGETGTGKELVARWLHNEDQIRNKKPFVKITIPNIGENIFESELFGYVKGAFTGALSSKKGLIEVAEEGTVFLDEIECATPSMQSKLLQLLEDRTYRKVGDTEYLETNARFIIASNRDLLDEVSKGSFRSDLYYRLAVLEIKLPSLKDRGNDILQIAQYYLDKYSLEINRPLKPLDPRQIELLISHDWNGNVRELKNAMEKAAVFSCDGSPDLSFLTENNSISKNNKNIYLNTNISDMEYKTYMNCSEEKYLRQILEANQGNVERTAQLMGMSIPFVYKKLRGYGIK